MGDAGIPTTQLAATVREQGESIKIVWEEKYPVPKPSKDEALVKVLYTGVCQSDLHTAAGTATGADGLPITAIKLPHVGGHEGVGRIIAFGPSTTPPQDVGEGTLVGIRFLSRVCHICEFCTSDREQHCQNATNHLHHEDGSFQEYCVLDLKYLTLLPQDIDPVVVGPVLCAGVTAYKAVVNAQLKKGETMVVIGAGGGLGHFAVQYGLAVGARVLAVDTGTTKKEFLESLGAEFIDFAQTKSLPDTIHSLTSGGAHAVVITTPHPGAFTRPDPASLLRINGALCIIGIPSGDVHLPTPVATLVIKGLRVYGNLVGSMKETMEAVELVRQGKVKPRIEVREFRELEETYARLERGEILGRVVLKIGDDDVKPRS